MKKLLLCLELIVSMILFIGCRETPNVMNVKIGDTREVALAALKRNGYELQFGVNPDAPKVATYNPNGILWGEDWKYITLSFGPTDKVISIELEKFGKIENKKHLDLMLLFLEDWYGKPKHYPGNALMFNEGQSHYAYFVMNNNCELILY